MPDTEPIKVEFQADTSDLVDGVREAKSAMGELNSSTLTLSQSMKQTMGDSKNVFRGMVEMRVALMSVQNLTKDLGIQNQFLTGTYQILNTAMDVAISLAAIERAAKFALAAAKWVSAKAGLAESAAEAGTVSLGVAIPIVVAAGLAAFAAVEGFHAAGVFAQGGIVTRPTFALVGEAGPEAIIPLSRGGGAGGVIVQGPLIGTLVSNDPDMISRELGRRIQQLANAGGF